MTGKPAKIAGEPVKIIGVPTKRVGWAIKIIATPVKIIGEPIQKVGEPMKVIGEPFIEVSWPVKIKPALDFAGRALLVYGLNIILCPVIYYHSLCWQTCCSMYPHLSLPGPGQYHFVWIFPG